MPSDGKDFERARGHSVSHMAAEMTMGALLGRSTSSHTTYTFFLAHSPDVSSSGAFPVCPPRNLHYGALAA